MAYRDVDLTPGGEEEEDYENLEVILKPTDGAGQQSMADNEAAADSVYETISCATQPAAEMLPEDNDTNDTECTTIASWIEPTDKLSKGKFA